jgi:hypothetical protein
MARHPPRAGAPLLTAAFAAAALAAAGAKAVDRAAAAASVPCAAAGNMTSAVAFDTSVAAVASRMGMPPSAIGSGARRDSGAPSAGPGHCDKSDCASIGEHVQWQPDAAASRGTWPARGVGTAAATAAAS